MKRRTLLILLLVCLLAPGRLIRSVRADQSEQEKGAAAGNQSGAGIASQLDSVDEIKGKTLPLQSSGSLMRTFEPTYPTQEQSVTFEAQLLAPSSSTFVELFAQPGASGDLSSAYVKQDTDFNGAPDYVYIMPVRISGVCADGIISCDAGTWNNCAYYRWTADEDLKVSLVEVSSIADLSACYCVNNRCGSNLVWNNLDIVLKDLGGGVVSAIQKRDPRCVITNVSVDGPVIKYYGQKTADMGAGYPYQTPQNPDGVYLSGATDINTMKQYYEAGSLPSDTEVADQSADIDSYYSQLVDSFSAQPDVDYVTCVITNTILVHTNPRNFQDSRNDVCCIGADHCVGMRNVYNEDTKKLFFQVGGAHAEQGADWRWNNMAILDLSDVSPASKITSVYFHVYFWGDGCNATHGSLTTLNAATSCFGVCPAGGVQWPHVRWDYLVQVAEDTPELVTEDQCNVDGSCRLKEEKVCDQTGTSCVTTWRNYNPTGLVPFPSCTQITTDVDVYTACMDGTTATLSTASGSQVLGAAENMWWRIERVYECESDHQYSFDDALTRTRHVRDSVRDDITTMYYEDYDPATGEIQAVVTSLQPRADYATCEQACKVRRPVEDTQAGVAGTTSDFRTSTGSYVYVYRKCVDGVCPVEDGETIVKNCACLNDFVEAASTMQMLNNAGKDVICSTD